MGLFFVVLSVLAITATSSSLNQHQETEAIAELSNKLASDIHKKLTAGEDGNVFFSPISIATALAMLFYGAKGDTANEMRRVLGYEEAGLTNSQVHAAFQNLVETMSKDSATKEYLLYLANAVFTQKGYPILDVYQVGLQEIYKATARNVDFQNQAEKVVQEINDWVKQKTNNQITQLLDAVDPSTVMVLLNAVYFKGTWKTKFENTMEGIFFNKGLETEKIKTPMMSYEEKVLYTQIDGAQAIELPYDGEDISMVIVLPNTLDGLSKLEENLTPNTLKEIRRSTRKTRALVTLPKFKLEYKKNLNSVLQDLGLKSVFERSADLRGISEDGKLTVSQVVHKAVVEVNEEGSEASGATGIVIVPVSAIIDDIRFVANHPFVFAMIDRRNDLVLFQGRVNKL